MCQLWNTICPVHTCSTHYSLKPASNARMKAKLKFLNELSKPPFLLNFVPTNETEPPWVFFVISHCKSSWCLGKDAEVFSTSLHTRSENSALQRLLPAMGFFSMLFLSENPRVYFLGIAYNPPTFPTEKEEHFSSMKSGWTNSEQSWSFLTPIFPFVD